MNIGTIGALYAMGKIGKGSGAGPLDPDIKKPPKKHKKHKKIIKTILLIVIIVSLFSLYVYSGYFIYKYRAKTITMTIDNINHYQSRGSDRWNFYGYAADGYRYCYQCGNINFGKDKQIGDKITYKATANDNMDIVSKYWALWFYFLLLPFYSSITS